MENQFGKLSKLHLTAAVKKGRTILEDVSFTAPFKVMHPFYEKKDMMTVMILTASAGIMAGDRQELNIRVREGANMEVLSQAYEKIHRMEEGYAKRETHIVVDAHAGLHYVPLPTLPFADSDYRSETRVDLADPTSRFVFREILSCGRIAHGEAFGYRRFQNRVSVYQNKAIVYRDNTCFEPERMPMQDFGLYEGYTHLANLLICNEPLPQEWVEQTRARIDAAPDMEGGVTETAAGHLVVRILGKSGDSLTRILEEIAP